VIKLIIQLYHHFTQDTNRFFGDIFVTLGMKNRGKIRDLKMKKIIGYIRTSKKGVQMNSIELQCHKIKDFCEKNNLVLDDLIIDEGISGKDIKNRKGFHSVLEMLENGELGTLIVLSLSRMGRNLKQNYETIEKMINTDTNLISLKENVDLSTPMGRFMVNIMNSLYQMEREMISDRVVDVLKDKKINGRVFGVVPYGFDRDGEVLIPNVKEQKMIRKIHKLKSDGLSYQKISDFLNRNKHTKKNGKKFSRYDVFHLVKTDRTEIGVN
jgi:site-specific DNA recombinase